MVDLFFKIGLPVLMIGVVTLVSHRYGPAVGGILGAVPAKGGPILLFLALEQNTAFAATSAAASLGGAGGCGVFCLVYARVCRRVSWPIAGAAASGAFALTWVAATLQPLGVLRAFALAGCAVVVVQFVELRSALQTRRPAADVKGDVAADLALPEAAE